MVGARLGGSPPTSRADVDAAAAAVVMEAAMLAAAALAVMAEATAAAVAVAMAAMAAVMAVTMAAPPATFLHACQAIRRAVSVCSMGCARQCRHVFEAQKAHPSSIEEVVDHVDRRKEPPAELPGSGSPTGGKEGAHARLHG